MIAHVEGIVRDKGQGFVVVDVGGVGFSLNTTLNAPANAQSGEKRLFYTHMSVREDAIELYGFLTREERAMFLRLISITGIGPKLALAILSVLSARELAVCVVSGDVNSLKRVPGIGPKVAQRIILELKDKVAAEDLTGSTGAPSQVSAPGSPADEALQALIALGYNSAEAARAISRVKDEADTVDAIIRMALRSFSS